MKTYDVIIVGAGPAGAMLGRLTHGRRIAILDRRPMDRDYARGDVMKSCGGLLAPQSRKFLRDHDIALPADCIHADQYEFVSATDFDIGVTRKYRRDYLNIDREKFDRFLARGADGDKYFGFSVDRIEFRDGMYVVNDMIAAPILVGADGASSIVRKTFFPNVKFKQYVSIQEVFDARLVCGYECYFDKSVSDYYGWALNKGGRTRFGYLIGAGADVADRFAEFGSRRGFGGQTAVSREGAMLVRPGFFHPCLARKNLFLVGEAGGYVSPSSAEGISYAMRTAEILARSDYDLRRYRRGMRRVRFTLFCKNVKALLLYTPIIRHIIMRCP